MVVVVRGERGVARVSPALGVVVKAEHEIRSECKIHPACPGTNFPCEVKEFILKSFDRRFIGFVRYPQGLRAHFRASSLLRPGLRVLDAGCGAGAVTLALREALLKRECPPAALHSFDLTEAMLERFRETLEHRAIDGIELVQANVLELERLPATWKNYDLIVSASMMEYLPRDRMVDALSGLRARLNKNGTFQLFITRHNWLMRPLIGKWWTANLYTSEELLDLFAQAGFSSVTFRRFPLAHRHLDLWGHIVEAQE